MSGEQRPGRLIRFARPARLAGCEIFLCKCGIAGRNRRLHGRPYLFCFLGESKETARESFREAYFTDLDRGRFFELAFPDTAEIEVGNDGHNASADAGRRAAQV